MNRSEGAIIGGPPPKKTSLDPLLVALITQLAVFVSINFKLNFIFESISQLVIVNVKL